jgi:hypothetical protein
MFPEMGTLKHIETKGDSKITNIRSASRVKDGPMKAGDSLPSPPLALENSSKQEVIHPFFIFKMTGR